VLLGKNGGILTFFYSYEVMLKSLHRLALFTSLSQIGWGLSCLIVQGALASPIVTTSPHDQQKTLQESATLSDRHALEVPNAISPGENVDAPLNLEELLADSLLKIPVVDNPYLPCPVSISTASTHDLTSSQPLPTREGATTESAFPPISCVAHLASVPTSLESLKIERDLTKPAFASPIAQENAQGNAQENPVDSPKSSPAQPASDTVETAADTGKLAQAAQNPIASLISVPFQYNFSFGIGPNDRTQYLLNVQPVIPTSLNDDWLLVSRIITPILLQPIRTDASTFGLGDLSPSFFFVPKSSGEFTWGVGPVFSFPTATDRSLGTGKWNVGPTAVAVWSPGKWVIGALANQLWSVAGDSSRPDVSQFLVQPFINYNLPDGWYLTSAPVITANWNASPGNQWTVPIGGGFGRVFRIDKQPVNVSLTAFWNVVKPEFGADWLIRFQFTLLFPSRG
jgi:hypothetical protein